MQLNGLLHGARLLAHVDFPTSEVLGPGRERGRDPGPDRPARADLHQAGVPRRRRQEGQGRADRQGADAEGGAGREGAALLLRAPARQRLRQGERRDLRGRACRPSTRSISRSPTTPSFRAPTMTLTHRGGMDIEELPKSDVAIVPFEALTGLKAFVVANALTDIGAPKEIISPLVQHLPKLWELVHHYGMTTLELNPIRMRPGPRRAADAGRLRLQVRLRPRRSAGGAARAAGPAVRRRHLGLRAGGEPAAHPPGAVGRLRHQRARARSSRRPSAAARTAS